MQILPFESDSWVLEGNGGILSEERILHFLKQCTGVEVVFLLVFSRRSLNQNSFLGFYFILLVSVLVITLGYNYLFNNDSLFDFLGGKERALSVCHFVFVLPFSTHSKIYYDCFGHYVRFSSRPSLIDGYSKWRD